MTEALHKLSRELGELYQQEFWDLGFARENDIECPNREGGDSVRMASLTCDYPKTYAHLAEVCGSGVPQCAPHQCPVRMIFKEVTH